MALADVIDKHIPAALLERVVFDQDVVKEPERIELFKASGLTSQEIARKVVEAYGDHAARLAFGLHEQVADTEWAAARALYEHFKGRHPEPYYNHQASLVSSIPTLPMDELSEFLVSVKRHVCLIVSRNGKQGGVVCGTGFLVGPDLVLTCRHVLKKFRLDADITANGNRIELYFDFYRGEPVDRLSPLLPGAIRIDLARQWHVESSEDTDPDGVEGALSDADAARIAKSLDFVLLRLAERVGEQPLERGRRRGWVTLPPDSVPQSLQNEDWIIIPQHPGGFPQRIDLGRYTEVDPTNTRIRYKTNTARGSSGAPCFNQKFNLVGVHNAFVGQPKATANQAIRLDHIAQRVRMHVQDGNVEHSALRWSIARPGEPLRVVLGREALLTWLRASATAKPTSLADRAYAVQASKPNAGATFTIDVLHAEIRDTKTPRAVYGERGQQLPASAEDFVASLLRELGIQLEKDEQLPERPQSGAGGTAPAASEVDKLARWLAHELPEWLGDVITRHVERQLDARDAARQAIAVYEQQGLDPPDELERTASSPDPVWVRPNAWDFAYVVIDGLRMKSYAGTGARTEFTGEVHDLIAGLVKGKPEQAMSPGLKRLRWMFLGYLPDFLPAKELDGVGAVVETLDPAAVGSNEVLAVLERMSLQHTRIVLPRPMARAWAKTIVRSAEVRNDLPWLDALEGEASLSLTELLKEFEN